MPSTLLSRRMFAGSLLLAPAMASAHRVSVIAHRGEHLAHPENTVAAIDAAIAAGADYVEIDVRTTSDGAYVLMHNETVDATTNGKGAVASFTLPRIRELRAGGERIPTLDEALAAMRGRCGVYLDAKRISAADIIDALKRHAMLDRAVVYGRFELLAELSRRGYAHLAMPEAVSAETLRKSLAEIRPRVVAFDRRDFQEEILAIAQAAGVGIFVDRLGPDVDNPGGWQEAIRRGATGIQTDHPAELAAALRAG